MSKTHWISSAIAGAISLNLVTVAAAFFLPATSIVVMAIILGLLGAALGALSGWAVAPEAAVEAVAQARPLPEEYRQAA
jgi:hypothetical protein